MAYEVEEPLGHQGSGHCQGSDVVWLRFRQSGVQAEVQGSTHGTLCAQDEWDRSPAERVEDNEEVHAHDGEGAVAVKRRAFGDRVNCLVDSYFGDRQRHFLSIWVSQFLPGERELLSRDRRLTRPLTDIEHGD